jgi:hypothetical protein
MSDYTPSTDEVGDAYIQMRVRESGASTPDERILASVDALPEWERWLAGHEAATRTRVVTTVAELDALPLGSVVLDADGDVWQMRERGLIPGSEWACTERAIPMSTGAALANAPFAPFRVLYEPEEGR